MTKIHIVRKGDCISSIAYEHGFFPGTLWDHPDNAELKRLRENPNVLFAGDVVRIADLRRRTMTCATDARHRFRRRGVPERLRVQLLEDGVPRVGLAFRVTVEGTIIEGTTGADGFVDVPIPPDAHLAALELPGSQEVFRLRLGRLDPVSEISGVQARLANLGFYHGAIDGELSPALVAAARAFQSAQGLLTTGELDGATRDRLEAAHDG